MIQIIVARASVMIKKAEAAAHRKVPSRERGAIANSIGLLCEQRLQRQAFRCIDVDAFFPLLLTPFHQRF